ncbi:hypothetical protein K491DRAFT_722675 [Lophiostoma macrostomum CBS 122681]|uniref:Uncharacterized protein n=1 Tax=Lophiostoma macrostomum CBS 122681 TaxID=1314788 RepID=A0A6A6SMY0_9PLEO|nr:hypothetical protein K491DRAFT_722675 [Lophiostoma macrostomum CBS 122681]
MPAEPELRSPPTVHRQGTPDGIILGLYDYLYHRLVYHQDCLESLFDNKMDLEKTVVEKKEGVSWKGRQAVTDCKRFLKDGEGQRLPLNVRETLDQFEGILSKMMEDSELFVDRLRDLKERWGQTLEAEPSEKRPAEKSPPENSICCS